MKKLFGATDGIRSIANQYPLEPLTIVKIGMTAAEFVKKLNSKSEYRVLIGKDTRSSGYMIENALVAGLTCRGVNVTTTGPIPTPAISLLAKSKKFDLGIMITASHNPYTDNGIKIFNSDGTKLNDEQELAFEELYLKDEFSQGGAVGTLFHAEEALAEYNDFLINVLSGADLSGLKIVVDTANGAAYKVAPRVLRELKANVIEINCSPDGVNINRDCGVLHPENLIKAVLREKADVGIALDGDADRVNMVDEKGNIIDGDYIMALLAKKFKNTGRLNKDTLVVTQYSNLALNEHLMNYGIKVDNSIVNGDRSISDLCKTEGYSLGGEQTGHFIIPEYADTGDGTMSALIVLKILVESGKSLSELAYAFEKFPQKKRAFDVNVKRPLEDIAELAILEVKWRGVFNGSGRVLVRYSGTENVLRVMVEAKDPGLLDACMDEFTGVIEGLGL